MSDLLVGVTINEVYVPKTNRNTCIYRLWLKAQFAKMRVRLS